MAYFFRLIAALVLLACSTHASATLQRYKAQGYTTLHSTAAAACADVVTTEDITVHISEYYEPTNTCYITYSPAGQTVRLSTTVLVVGVNYTCPAGTVEDVPSNSCITNGGGGGGAGECVANSEMVNGSCQCKVGYSQGSGTGGGCWPNDANNLCSSFNGLVTPSATEEVNVGSMSSAQMAATLGRSRNFCAGGCVASGITQAALKSNSGAVTLLVTGAKYNGSQCSTTAAAGSGDGEGQATTTVDASSCSAKKMCSGVFNGTTICTTCITTAEGGTGVKAGTTTTTTTASGTGTGTTTSTSTTGGGTTTKSTVCEGNKCSTTVTTVDQSTTGAGTTTSSTTEQTRDDFCTSNPKAAACVTGSFGGSCSGGFTCGGDAVQCALAKETFRQNCAMQPSQAVIDGYTAAAGKTGPQVTQTAVEITSSMFSQENVLGAAASCIADKSITVAVAGKSFALSLPFSKVCPYLEYLGYINLALSFILAARIVGRG